MDVLGSIFSLIFDSFGDVDIFSGCDTVFFPEERLFIDLLSI